MTFKKNLFVLSVATALVGLTACDVTPQDEGTGESETRKLSGIAVDGYVAGATVYADTNQNNKLDAWEPRALTDTQGYFSYNPVTGTNYCESSDEAHEKFCLSAPIGYDEVILRITKGFDLTTMEPFTGTLSMRMSITDSVINIPQMTSPITGLLAYMNEAQQAEFFTAEGVAESDIGKDFLNFSDSTEIADEAERRKLLTLALKIHKVADMIAGRLNLKFDQDVLADPNNSNIEAEGFFGIAEGVANDASDLAYQAIAGLVNSATSASTIMADETMMKTVVENTWKAFNAVIEEHNNRKLANADDEDPSQVDGLFESVSVNVNEVNTIAGDAVVLADLADSLFSSTLTEIIDDNGTPDIDSDDKVISPFAEDVASRIKALDIVSYLMREDKHRNTAETNNAMNLASDSTYLNHLRSNKTDVAGLKDKFLSTPGSVTASSADYSERQSFTGLLKENNDSGANTAGFTVENDKGMAGNALNISEGEDNVAIVFASESDDLVAKNGTVAINASFADGIFASSDEGNTADTINEETALTGTWEQLDEYTMLMNVEVAGVNQPVIIKPTLDDSGKAAYYFDMGGEQGVWTP